MQLFNIKKSNLFYSMKSCLFSMKQINIVKRIVISRLFTSLHLSLSVNLTLFFPVQCLATFLSLYLLIIYYFIFRLSLVLRLLVIMPHHHNIFFFWWVSVCLGSWVNQRAVTVPSTVKHLSREQSEINYIIELHRAVNHTLSENERDAGREFVYREACQRDAKWAVKGVYCVVEPHWPLTRPFRTVTLN